MHRCRLCIFAIILFGGSVSIAQEMGEDVFSLDSLLSLPVSTASKYKQTTAQTPASISVITSAELQNFHYRTLADVLNRVRGMYTSSDRNYSYAGIRGFGRMADYNNRLLLLVDGHTFNENVYGSALIGSEFGVPLEAIERIEIVRGPGSALYGTGAMFGVVNVITKDYHALDGVRASASYGSFGERSGELQFGKEFSRGSGIMLSAEYGHEDGADIYFAEFDARSTHDGIASNADWDTFYGITAKLTLPNTVIRSGFTSRDKGIPTASFFTLFNDPRAKTRDARQFIDALYATPVAEAAEISVRLYGDRYYYTGTYPYEEILREESTGLWWGTEVRLQWDPASTDRLVIGAEFQNDPRSDYITSYAGAETFNRNRPFSVVSCYAQNEYQWYRDLAITAGLRFDHTTTTGGTFSPRLAVNWNAFDGGMVKFLVGRAFRVPNFYELYYNEPLSGYKDNPSLSPEIITTWELALEQRLSDQFHASLSLFKHSMTDLIDQQLDPADSLYNFQNLGTISARGAEIELEYRWGQRMHWYGVASTQRADNTLTQETLTNSPLWLARSGVFYKFTPWLQASVEASYDSGRLTVKQGATPSFTLLHSKLTFSPVADRVHVSLCARNLLDSRYYLPGGSEHLQAMIPQMGRQLIVKTECSF